MPEMLTLEAFEEASEKVKEVTLETKLIESPYLSAATGNRMWLKPENMQRTGAYKVRGAYYKISTLTDEERAHGLITASAGNHAQGVAYAATHAGARSIVVMPTTTPLIRAHQGLIAEVVLAGNVYDEAQGHAPAPRRTASRSSFNDLGVATGQGTIAMEIIQELPLVDSWCLSAAAGLPRACPRWAKLLNPTSSVIGVEPTGAACLKASLEAGHVVKLPQRQHHRRRHRRARARRQDLPLYIQENLDDIITVDDDS